MSNHPFKLILCDLGNVLLNFDHRIAARRILKFSDKTFDEVYQVLFDSGPTKDFEEGNLTAAEFFKKLRGALHFSEALSFREFQVIWNEIFFDTSGVLDILKILKEKKYRLHLVSNINELHYGYIAKNFPRHLKIFDKIYLSYKVGWRKPDSRIYQEARAGLSLAPGEILYTDDREDLLFEAAKIGFKTLLFKNVEGFKKELQRLGVM